MSNKKPLDLGFLERATGAPIYDIEEVLGYEPGNRTRVSREDAMRAVGTLWTRDGVPDETIPRFRMSDVYKALGIPRNTLRAIIAKGEVVSMPQRDVFANYLFTIAQFRRVAEHLNNNDWLKALCPKS